ncbi:MAG: hypothetical protein WA634_17700 [Silvibacterium sp.]
MQGKVRYRLKKVVGPGQVFGFRWHDLDMEIVSQGNYGKQNDDEQSQRNELYR